MLPVQNYYSIISLVGVAALGQCVTASAGRQWSFAYNAQFC